ncbi:MAG: hypothetical protein GWP91_15710 [Rhodobacterales bacterium]|nr:hypothetical protein [Rhodobacterales bacterium]
MNEKRGEYLGEQLTQMQLQRERERRRSRQADAVHQVDRLMQTQQALGESLGNGLSSLQSKGQMLQRLEVERTEGSLLATLVRPFTANRQALARRSVAEELIALYERVGVRLREATHFADQVKLTALEMQQEVDGLHRALAEALHNQRTAAKRVLEAERALDSVEVDELPEAVKARRRDRYTFDLRTEAVNLELYGVSMEQCRVHLAPARALRDTVLQLHEDMSKYVINATHTVNAAGRRIQGLGVMADAPTVVAELQESLDELSEAMAATEKYIEASQLLVDEVLPKLTAKLDAQDQDEVQFMASSLETVDRARSHRMAERALRQEAAREIESLLGGSD